MKNLLPARQLVALLNCLPRQFTIYSPLLRLPLVEVTLDDRPTVAIACGKRQYEEAVRAVAALPWFSVPADHVVPKFDAIRFCLRQAGISPFSEASEQELAGMFREIQKAPQAGFEGADHFYIGFDNNLLRRRLPATHFFSRLREHTGPRRWDLLMDPHCRNELARGRGADKISGRFGREPGAPGWIAEVFPRQPSLDSRARTTGLRQIERAFAEFRARETPWVLDPADLQGEIRRARDVDSSGAAGALIDSFIARAHEAFCYRNQHSRLYFLTSDKNMESNFCGVTNARCLVLIEPDDAGRRETLVCPTWEHVCDLLYAAASHYGRLHLLDRRERLLVTLDGLWTHELGGGRGPDHDRAELVRLIVPRDTDLAQPSQERLRLFVRVLGQLAANE